MLAPHWLVVGALVEEDDLVLAELDLGLLAAFVAHVFVQAWRLPESRHGLLHGEVDLEQHEVDLLVVVVVLEHPHYGGVGLEDDVVLEDPHYGGVDPEVAGGLELDHHLCGRYGCARSEKILNVVDDDHGAEIGESC